MVTMWMDSLPVQAEVREPENVARAFSRGVLLWKQIIATLNTQGGHIKWSAGSPDPSCGAEQDQSLGRPT